MIRFGIPHGVPGEGKSFVSLKANIGIIKEKGSPRHSRRNGAGKKSTP